MIRKYTEKDILPMVELENEVFCSSLGMAFYHRDLSNPLACHWVLIENGVFIGFISSIFDGVSAEILNFCIKPAFQRQTNGSRLFEFYLDYLQKKQAETIVLEVRQSNRAARAFYDKYGFKCIRIRKNYYQEEDALFLQKNIR